MKPGASAAIEMGLAMTSHVAAINNEYTIPSGWAKSRSGNNKSRSKSSKERARSKTASKSRRAQRKGAKR